MRKPGLLNVLAPRILVFLVYVTGVLLLFSATIFERVSHLKILENRIPVVFTEISHLASSLIGLTLIFLAEGLRKRIDTAYILTIALLVIAAILALPNGFNAVEALGLLTLTWLVYTSRSYFHRKGSIFRMDYSAYWIVSSVFVVIAFIALGITVYRHVEYSDELWWKFELNAGAPRFLRAALGVFILLLLVSLSRILSLVPPKFKKATDEELKRVRAVLASSARYSAGLALLGDKSFLFSKNSRAFLMYRVRGRSWIALGDPVGPHEEWKELIFEFRRAAHAYNGWPVFFEIGKEHLSLFLDLGFNLMKIGEEARLRLPDFHLEDPPFHDLRKAMRKITDKGFSFEVLEPAQGAALMSQLKNISDAWLRAKGVGEKCFSLGSFQADYLKNFRIALVRLRNEPFAFANIWVNADGSEFSADLMRYNPADAPNGLMDYLFANLILWGRTQPNVEWFNLGMVPLSGLEHHEFAPLWLRLGDLVYRHGEHFYNFQGLRQYKEKFQPQWEPKYLAWGGSLALPKVLADLSLLISGGYRGIFLATINT